jgi:hypothetical protein
VLAVLARRVCGEKAAIKFVEKDGKVWRKPTEP